MQVIMTDADMVWYNPRSCTPQVGDTIAQNDWKGSLPELFTAFQSEWAQRWDRHRNVTPDRWDEVSALIQHLPDVPARPSMPILTEDFLREVRRKKSTAATGPDGLARSDVLAMPTAVVDGLVQVCSQAELSGVWPRQVITGIVSSLQKGDRSSVVGDYRPITIYSLTYRTWSSIRGRQVLSHLQQYCSQNVFGNVPKRHAKQIWWQTQQRVSFAVHNHLSFAGLVCDICKAFNCLPREPIFQAAIRLGVPDSILRAWWGALHAMERRFRIRGSIGPPVSSCTGFAEGCALSCAAMVLVDILFEVAVNMQVPRTTPMSYVDNWTVQADHADDIVAAFRAVQRFANAVDLTLDLSKTYVWATTAQGRQKLKQAGLTVSLGAKDLGAQMNFCAKSANKAQMRRFSDMHDMWIKFKRCCSPYRVKVQALKVAAWPRALYGASVVHLPWRVFGALRTGATQGLGVGKPGANPLVHLGLIEGPKTDPCFLAIIDAIKDMREFGPAEQAWEHTCELARLPMAKYPTGPCGVLLSRLH